MSVAEILFVLRFEEPQKQRVEKHRATQQTKTQRQLRRDRKILIHLEFCLELFLCQMDRVHQSCVQQRARSPKSLIEVVPVGTGVHSSSKVLCSFEVNEILYAIHIRRLSLCSWSIIKIKRHANDTLHL